MPQFITEDIVRKLADSGCKSIVLAFETGNEVHRRKIFNKQISNKSFIECADLFQKYKIEINTNAIFIYPEQTVEDAYLSIELAIRMKTHHPYKTFLNIYPNTDIYLTALKNKNLSDEYDFKDIPPSFFEKSNLKHIFKKDLETLYCFYYFFVKYPYLYYFIKNRLWILEIIPFKKIFNYAGIFLWFKNFKNVGYIKSFFYIWRFRKNR